MKTLFPFCNISRTYTENSTHALCIRLVCVFVCMTENPNQNRENAPRVARAFVCVVFTPFIDRAHILHVLFCLNVGQNVNVNHTQTNMQKSVSKTRFWSSSSSWSLSISYRDRLPAQVIYTQHAAQHGGGVVHVLLCASNLNWVACSRARVQRFESQQ